MSLLALRTMHVALLHDQYARAQTSLPVNYSLCLACRAQKAFHACAKRDSECPIAEHFPCNPPRASRYRSHPAQPSSACEHAFSLPLVAFRRIASSLPLTHAGSPRAPRARTTREPAHPPAATPLHHLLLAPAQHDQYASAASQSRHTSWAHPHSL